MRCALCLCLFLTCPFKNIATKKSGHGVAMMFLVSLFLEGFPFKICHQRKSGYGHGGSEGCRLGFCDRLPWTCVSECSVFLLLLLKTQGNGGCFIWIRYLGSWKFQSSCKRLAFACPEWLARSVSVRAFVLARSSGTKLPNKRDAPKGGLALGGNKA